MKVYWLIFFLSVLLMSCENPGPRPAAPPRDAERTFKLCLYKMKQAGFTLNRDIESNDVFEDWQHKLPYYHYDSITTLYVALAGHTPTFPAHDFSDCCSHIYMESMTLFSPYVYVLDELKRISKGDLNFENARDYSNKNNDGKAWVAFRFEGEDVRWDLAVDGNWIDAGVFQKIQDLCAKHHKKGRLTCFPDGDALVISYLTENQFLIIRRHTGLKLAWLKVTGKHQFDY